MKLLYRSGLVFFVFILCSCNSWDGTPASPPGPTHPSGSTYPPSETALPLGPHCPAQTFSWDECRFNLPAKAYGETSAKGFIKDSNIETTGVIVGRGKWICNNGVWRALHPMVCHGCRPGLSVDYCKNELDKLVEKAKRGEL